MTDVIKSLGASRLVHRSSKGFHIQRSDGRHKGVLRGSGWILQHSALGLKTHKLSHEGLEAVKCGVHLGGMRS